MRIPDASAFKRLSRSRPAESRQPIVEVIRMYPKQVPPAMGVRFAENGGFYTDSVFVLTYATQVVKFEQQQSSTAS